MSYVFITSCVILLILSTYIISSLVERNIVTSFLISLSTFFSYISILSILGAMTGIEITFQRVMGFNLVLIFLIILFVIKTKRTLSNQLEIDRFDIVAMTFGVISVFIVFLKQYGMNFDIQFITTDPAVHFVFSKYFSDTGNLLLASNSLQPYMHMSTYPFLTYSVTGLFMSITQSVDLKVKIYILSNLLFYFLIIMTVYSIIKKYIYKKNWTIIIFTLILVSLGYNLNSVIFGFSSQMVGVFIFLCSILLSDSLFRNRQPQIFLTTLLIFNLIGLFYSYYLFVPAIFLGITLYEISRKKQELIDRPFYVILTSRSFIIGLMLLIFGSLYLFSFPSADISTGSLDNLKAEGYIFRDLYSDIIPLLLFVLIGFMSWYKDKRDGSLYLISISTILFVIAIFILVLCDKASTYYYFKNYYLLNNLLIILFAVGLSCLIPKFNRVYIASMFFLVMMLLNSFFLDKYVASKNHLLNPLGKNFFGEIYHFNLAKLIETEVLLNKEQQELINYVFENKEEYTGGSNQVPVIGNMLQRLWFYSISGIWPTISELELRYLYDDNIVNLEEWKKDQNKNPYIIVLEGSDKFSEKWMESQKFSINDFEVIYQVNGGKILKYIY